MKILFTFFSVVLWSALAIGQNTVGLLSYSPMQSYDGYNLIYPHNQSSVFLLNNCGEIVHEWTDDANWRPGNTAYLTEEGLLYKTKRDATVTSDRMWAGGGGAIIEIRDWDNNLIWQYTLNNDSLRLHHDIALTPEGTVLAIAWELKTEAECAAVGRDVSTLDRAEMWPDIILEIDPETDEIVWEWRAWDHLIQDFDETKDNFGVVAEHPELIDVNYGRVDGHPDWMHANSIDYNDELKQILLSVPYFDEVWIIDHTTTTEEAAGNFGGFSDKGGDLMYRWGNPITYDRGDSTDQLFFFQHDAHWIDDFLDPSHPQYGKIAVYNNRFTPTTSVASVITPPWEMYDWKYLDDGNIFLPETYDFNISHPEPTRMWSTGLSSIQFLPNGNRLAVAGRFGYAFELTPDNDIVWEYRTPLNRTARAAQGDTLAINNNLTFRIDRYPLDYPAFDGQDLSSKGWIEQEPNEDFCDLLTSTEEVLIEQSVQVFPNPADDVITVEWDGMMKASVAVLDMKGTLIFAQHNISGGRTFINVSTLESGMYIVMIDQKKAVKVIVE